MQVLLTYDVETMTPEGRKRLRQVAKVCTDYGQRVQNSVFELNIDPATLVVVKSKINDIIDAKKIPYGFITWESIGSTASKPWALTIVITRNPIY